MDTFNYTTSPYAVRPDLKQAYSSYWDDLARAGSWWTGAERVAIAQEVRNATACTYCALRKQALSPYHFPGNHDHSGSLSELAIDAVHRIITDQDRITQAWIDSNADGGLSEEQYVELLGVTVTVFSIDEFNRALGLPLEPLPQPLPGAPDQYRPARAVRGTGFVSMLPNKGKFTEREKGLWPKNRSANVLRALSLVPDAVRDWSKVAAAQYLPAELLIQFKPDVGRSINRMQIEIIAGRVSSINECFY
ncbi:MAG: alkylhydroperoxidase-related (seleno)protein [Halioglobus sp.]|nr:alkylhydroperoxidase-related (seleno)protein [Halioglobus sp.]